MSCVGSASLHGDLTWSFNLGVGGISAFHNSCGPILNSRRFGLTSKTQNITPTRHFTQLLTTPALAFTFCNTRKWSNWEYIGAMHQVWLTWFSPFTPFSCSDASLPCPHIKKAGRFPFKSYENRCFVWAVWISTGIQPQREKVLTSDWYISNSDTVFFFFYMQCTFRAWAFITLHIFLSFISLSKICALTNFLW